jgi:hypothetical protein
MSTTDAFSDFVEYTILQALFGGQSATALTLAGGPWIGLHQATQTDTGGASEVSTTAGYVRVQVATANWTINSSGTMLAKNNAAVTFAANTGTAWVVTDLAFFNHSSNNGATNFMGRGPLSASVTINSGDTFQFAASAINFQVQ